MEGLEVPSAKLLYIVSELWKQGVLSDSEKSTIKGKIVSDDPQIFAILERFEKDADENLLKESIIDIVRPKEEPVVGLGLVLPKRDQQEQPQPLDEATSPLGNQLFERKKKHQTGNELQGLIKTIKPVN